MKPIILSVDFAKLICLCFLGSGWFITCVFRLLKISVYGGSWTHTWSRVDASSAVSVLPFSLELGYSLNYKDWDNICKSYRVSVDDTIVSNGTDTLSTTAVSTAQESTAQLSLLVHSSFVFDEQDTANTATANSAVISFIFVFLNLLFDHDLHCPTCVL